MDETIVGTYEGFLLGYSVSTEDTVPKLKQTFATHSHTASVRCVTIGGKFLASGGTDDRIVVIDLKTRKEHTVLMNHDGTINTVAFTHNGTHLLSGSDDGSIIVTRTGNWQIEKMWKKAHGGEPVIAITIHPTDKLALSIGGDKTLRTWNLIKGRPAFTINLASKGISMPTEIKFSPGGDRFSLVYQQSVDIWTLNKAAVEKHITCNSKPTTVQWVTDEKLFVGLENGNIISLTVSDTKASTYQAHKQRVKCLHYENDMLYSASSAGEVKVWAADDNLLEICSSNAGCRLTCVVLNKQASNSLIKKEEASDDEQNKEVSIENENTDDEDDHPAEKIVQPVPQKKQPGALVKISYGSDDDSQEETSPPPKKKFKKRKRNKKPKINKSDD